VKLYFFWQWDEPRDPDPLAPHPPSTTQYLGSYQDDPRSGTLCFIEDRDEARRVYDALAEGRDPDAT
jgi:hypothetical protein